MGQSSLSTSCTRTGCSQLPCQPWPGVWLSLSSLLSALSWQNPNLCSGEEEDMKDMEDTEEGIEEAMVAAEVDTMARDLLSPRQPLQLIHTIEDMDMGDMVMVVMEATEDMEVMGDIEATMVDTMAKDLLNL